MNLKQAGLAVKACRKQRKLSMRDCARMGGTSPSTWSSLEAGEYPPALMTQRAVAKALRWPLDWLDRLDAGENWESFPETPPLPAPMEELRDAFDELLVAEDEYSKGDVSKEQHDRAYIKWRDLMIRRRAEGFDVPLVDDRPLNVRLDDLDERVTRFSVETAAQLRSIVQVLEQVAERTGVDASGLRRGGRDPGAAAP